MSALAQCPNLGLHFIPPVNTPPADKLDYLSLLAHPIFDRLSYINDPNPKLARALFQSITPDSLKNYGCAELKPIYRHAMLLVHPDKNSHLNYWEANMASVHLNNAIETACKK